VGYLVQEEAEIGAPAALEVLVVAVEVRAEDITVPAQAAQARRLFGFIFED
jgi:hypothetical protein